MLFCFSFYPRQIPICCEKEDKTEKEQKDLKNGPRHICGYVFCLLKILKWLAVKSTDVIK